MGRPATIDRDQVLKLLQEEVSQRDIATRFGVSEAAISKIVRRLRSEGLIPEVQPVAPEPVEIVPRPAFPPTPVGAPITPIVGPGSEWRGITLSQTLGERYRQINIVDGPKAATEFAIRESWLATRQGSSVEAISQQFDVSTETVAEWITEAHRRAVERVNQFDARVSLASAMSDLELSRQACLRTLTSGKSSEAARALARDALIRLAGREVELAVAVEQFRAARGLTDGDSGADDMNSLSFWTTVPKKGAR